jgi:hypothetical protein
MACESQQAPNNPSSKALVPGWGCSSVVKCSPGMLNTLPGTPTLAEEEAGESPLGP